MTKRSKIPLLQFLLFLVISLPGVSQEKKPREADRYLEILENAKDSLYNQVLTVFDKYIEETPGDVSVKIERCKLIGKAMYDTYEDYNPNEEEYSHCVRSLVEEFPAHHEVLLYWLDNTWGDSAIAIGNQILNINRSDPGSWKDSELSKVYQKLARQYQYSGTAEQVIEHAELAQLLDDSIDLTYLMAQQYLDKNQYQKAKTLLLSKVDSTDDGHLLKDKANLLLEIGMDKDALLLFKYAQKDSSVYLDHGKIAQALIKNEHFGEARTYLLEDLNSSYFKTTALHSLFLFDYDHSPKDSVLNTYKKLIADDFHNDTFGKYRFMMIFKTPFQAWKLNDALKLIFFLLLMIILVIIPYAWILPIHFISQRFAIINPSPALQASKWSLTDFWIISSFVMIIEVLAWIVFDYQDMLASFFSDVYSEPGNIISLNQANYALFYFSLVMVLTLGYLKRSDYRFLTSSNWKIGKSIGLAILLSFLLRAVYFNLARKGILPGFEASMMGSVVDSLKSINQYYNPLLTFLFAVIIVPFYEEYIFRGIILNSMDRRIKFIAANIIQSIFFALLHDNLSLFPFYFLFGLITGFLVKKSNSLLPAVVFHSTNNLFAFIVIMRM